MSELNLKNELTKLAWKMSNNMKDVVTKNIVKAVSSKEVNVPRESLQRLIMLIQASIEEAFEGSLKDFQKTVEKFLPVETHVSQKNSVVKKVK